MTDQKDRAEALLGRGTEGRGGVSEGKAAPCMVGDWVRFRQAGRLVIGHVEYVELVNDANHYWTIQTDIGEIWEQAIMEKR